MNVHPDLGFRLADIFTGISDLDIQLGHDTPLQLPYTTNLPPEQGLGQDRGFRQHCCAVRRAPKVSYG